MIQSQSPLIASLPWYDLPGSAIALDRFWASLSDQLIKLRPDLATAIPPELNRNSDLEQQWNSPRLILSQCCGPDLFRPDTPNLEVIGRPVFSTLNCERGYYYSHIVSHGTQLNKRPRLVANAPTSRSGYIALQEWLLDQDLEPQSLVFSGSHQQSLNWLKEGKADLAAIDAHSWHWLKDTRLKVIGQTATAPTPPYVKHKQSPVSGEELLHALRHTLEIHAASTGVSEILEAEKDLYRACAIRPAEMETESPDQSGLCPAPA